MEYRREIDGLRAVAVVPVILFHAGFEFFSGGFVGVDVFFVISGYLITYIIIKERADNNFSLAGFYERRARRILPALFLIMLCCIPLAWFLMLPSSFKDFGESVGATSLFASNLLFWHESGYFAGPAELKPLLHTWSLAVEEQYYLFYPPIILIIWRLGFKWMPVILGIAGLVSLVIAQYGSTQFPGANFYFLPTRGWELLIGGLCALYIFHHVPYRPASRPFLSDAFGILGLILIGYAVFAFDSNTPFPSVWALLPVVGTALIILFAAPQNWIGKILGQRLLVGVGLISYSLYLWHQPLFAFARLRQSSELTAQVYAFLIGLSLLLAYLSWRYIENYFRSRKNLSRKAIFSYALLGMVFFCTVAVAVVKTDGFKYRFPYINEQLAKTTDEFAAYVQGRFQGMILRDFDPNDPSRKLLIIGDSYAKDITNVVFESDLHKSFQVSTHEINANCGNLLLDDYSRIRPHIPKRCLPKRSRIMPNGRFDDPQVLKLIKEADQVWLISRWFDWVADYLPESLENLQKITDAKIYVIGPKNFGEINFRQIVEMRPENRIGQTNPISTEALGIHEKMKRLVPESQFINLVDLYCDSKNQCRLFDDNGFLMSHDGGHLTKEGAVYFGARLEYMFGDE